MPILHSSFVRPYIILFLYCKTQRTKSSVHISFVYELNSNLADVGTSLDKVKVYVGEDDGSLHFVDSTGADSVLPFSSAIQTFYGLSAGVSNIFIITLPLKKGDNYIYMAAQSGISSYSTVTQWTPSICVTRSYDIITTDTDITAYKREYLTESPLQGSGSDGNNVWLIRYTLTAAKTVNKTVYIRNTNYSTASAFFAVLTTKEIDFMQN